MSRQTFSDELWNGLGNAITDIRQKVVEEPMYGRAVTDGPEGPRWPEAQEPEPSFGSVTHTIDVGPSRDQMQENATYRLAAMERELGGGQWPQARDTGPQRDKEQDIDLDR
jgi:hypothetical protein